MSECVGIIMVISSQPCQRQRIHWFRGLKSPQQANSRLAPRGLYGLKPKSRAQGALTSAQILELEATVKLERSARTADQIRRIMADTLGDASSESVLLRHCGTLHIPTGNGEVCGRFEADYPNELGVGDGLQARGVPGTFLR
ncbi:MAG: hypothetical protein LH475_06925 [Cryobacterium sp.]|uniref:hypothetical protein n=1 Tax=unclassified Cryobacterium TaxID=2649013 RepID=UPI0018CBD365|nr:MULTISPECIES: hypothetical protein [unclassified Cryobacterium]MCY7404342.1 hypothetical protein [Cryobacterium sp.]